MKRAHSRARNTLVIERLNAGECLADLAAEFDLSPNYIRLIAVRAGVVPPRKAAGHLSFIGTKRASSLKRRAAIIELHTLGISGGTARKLLSMSTTAFAYDIRKLGLKFPYDRMGKWGPVIKSARERAAKMAALYRSGMTLQQIGDKYGLSRERVRQLMTKHEGMRQDGGGQHCKAVAKRQRSAADRDAKYLSKYGCTFDQYVEVRTIGREMVRDGAGIYQTPLRAFLSQRNNAKARGIYWDLTFWQWWTIWQESGKWELRGRARDAFVMSRFGDAGAYTAGNVYIGTLAENSSIQPNNPYRKDHPDHASLVYSSLKQSLEQRLSGKALPNKKNSDLPRGVTRKPNSNSYQAQATLGGKSAYLGTFPTVEQARAAYVAAVIADVNTARKTKSEAA